MRSAIAVALVLGTALLGCASLRTPIPSGYVDLVTMTGVSPNAGGGTLLCAGVGFVDSVLRGSQSAADPVWLEPLASPSARAAVRRPAGFRARFVPALELLDPTGAVIAREGDTLTGLGGVPGSDGRLNIDEFDGRTYPCF